MKKVIGVMIFTGYLFVFPSVSSLAATNQFESSGHIRFVEGNAQEEEKTISSKSKESDRKTKFEKIPQTGDQANETFIVLTGALALAAAYILLKQEKRKRNENE